MKKFLLSLFILSYSFSFDGFMASSFDEFSTANVDFNDDKFIFTQNRYQMSGSFLQNKNYTTSEDALRYLPLVSFVNSGFGAMPTLRNMKITKFYLNGIPIDNSLQNLHGFSPLNTINTSFIQSIRLTLGSSSVLYGGNAKGGVVEIETFTPFLNPVFAVGAGYNLIENSASSYNGDIHYKDRFGSYLLDLGFGYVKLGGQRQNDSATQIATKLALDYDFNAYDSLNLNADFFHTQSKWGEFNGFGNYSNYQEALRRANARSTPEKIYSARPAMNSLKANGPISASKQNRQNSTPPPPIITQDRLSLGLKYQSYLNQNAKFSLHSFLHFNQIKYKPNDDLSNDYMEFSGLVFKDMSKNYGGSSFDESKYGLNLKFDLAHKNGKFELGTQSLYERGKSVVARELTNDQLWVVFGFNHTNSVVLNYLFDSFAKNQSTRLTNAIYAFERYDFNERFSIKTGARYELSNTKLDIQGIHKNISFKTQQNTPNSPFNATTEALMNENYNGSQSKNHLAFELVPSFMYSSSGLLYMMYQRGYTSLPPVAQRKFSNARTVANATNANLVDINYEPINSNESYDSFEFGFKDFFTSENLTLLLSANAFYTLTKNEFYMMRNYNPTIDVRSNSINSTDIFTGEPNPYNNYEKTRRMGIELAFEQYLFNGKIALNESLSTMRAEFFDKKWQQLPYSYAYKATLGANLELFPWLSFWTQTSFFGAQKITHKIPVTNANNVPQFSADRILLEREIDESLEPYFITDVGLTVKFKTFSLNAGVRNINDTFYYDYYNLDKIDTILNYGYIIGTGRSYFIKANLRY